MSSSPDGAGESTIADHFVDVPTPIINPGNIARMLPPELAMPLRTELSDSISRIREQVSRRRHDVPIDDILRRFNRSPTNPAIAGQLANHRTLLIDNVAGTVD